MSKAAVFIDRDGTISEEVGYVNHLSRYRLYPFAAEAIKLINASPLKAILITNQAGVARGYFEEQLVRQVHDKLTRELGQGDARLDAIYYCPHHPSVGDPPYRQDCNCRKPRSGLLEQAAADFELSLTRSYMIGDRYSDIRLAHRVGARGILVLTGYGLGEYEHQSQAWERPPDHVAEDLLAAVRWVIRQELAANCQPATAG